jgi:hypothetical protein
LGKSTDRARDAGIANSAPDTGGKLLGLRLLVGWFTPANGGGPCILPLTRLYLADTLRITPADGDSAL